MMKIKLLDPDCRPYHAHAFDAGLDLRARLDEPTTIRAGSRRTIPVGIAVQVPPGMCGDIRPRSGLATRGIRATLGTIDPGYRGEVKVVLHNEREWRPYTVEPYQRIAQLVLVHIEPPAPVYVEELEESDRGDSGLGSTGVS